MQIKIDRLPREGWTFADIAPRQAGRWRTSQSTMHFPGIRLRAKELRGKLELKAVYGPEKGAQTWFREPSPKTSTLLRCSDYHNLRST
jgi:hypothetical protein